MSVVVSVRTNVDVQGVGRDYIVLETVPDYLANLPGFDDLPELIDPQPAGNNVQAEGDALFQVLLNHHGFKNLRIATQALQPNRQPYPLYFRLGSNRAEGFAWEALYEAQPGRFLALNGWPVVRLVRAPAPPELAADPPFKVLAVLAAAGEDLANQYQVLVANLTTLAAHGVPYQLSVLTCQSDLVATIKKNGAMADFVPNTPAALLDRIAAFGPHVLHFGCHGDIANGAHLEIATKSDWDADLAAGSLELRATDFAAHPKFQQKSLPSLWLVVLNCCLGAAPTPQLIQDPVPGHLHHPSAKRSPHRCEDRRMTPH